MELVKFQNNKAVSSDDKSSVAWKNSQQEEELIVETFTTEKHMDELASHWEDLAERADSMVYMSHDWATNWWQHFGKNEQRSLYLVTVWEGTKLVALAPFYLGHSKLGPLTLERRMQVIGSGGSPNEQVGYMDDYGISDFLDIIVDTDYRDQVTDLLADMITQNALGIDVLTLHQANEDSYIMQHLYPKLEEMGLEVEKEQTDTCPYIDLSGYDTMKEYIKDQKSSARRRIRQTLRAIGGDGKKEYDIEPVESWEEVEKATDKLIQLHQERWNEIGFPGVFYDERFTNFFKDIIKDAYENDRLWFKQAVDNWGVCASRMILKYNGRYYDYISGFDQDRPSSKYRPGIGLLIDLVKETIEGENEVGDAHRIELLRGEEKYKYDFTSSNFDNYKLTIPLKNKRKNPLLALNRLAAVAYKYGTRESELLKVQRDQVGVKRMFSEYFKFRWKSIKIKYDL